MDRLTEADYQALGRICPGGLFRNVDLSQISRWRIGGKADLILQPSSPEQIVALRRWFHERDMHHVVFGATSNLLFADEGLHAPCIQIGERMSKIDIQGNVVNAQAGAWVPGLARRIMQAGLTGAEHTCGIPGTLGGLICMNGGSLRKGIGSSVLSVESVDASGCVMEREWDACDFAYRQSIYQTNGEVITNVRLQFEKGERDAIRREMLRILADRRNKFPRKQPNCGSVFKSNPAMYAEIGPPGLAIERLGFKGQRIGGAVVSPYHANFIVNTGGATSSGVLELISLIDRTVETVTGYKIEAEVSFVRFDGRIFPANKILA